MRGGDAALHGGVELDELRADTGALDQRVDRGFRRRRLPRWRDPAQTQQPQGEQQAPPRHRAPSGAPWRGRSPGSEGRGAELSFSAEPDGVFESVRERKRLGNELVAAALYVVEI